MHSCLYQGHVWHRRRKPVMHAFRYPLYLAYLDLAEVDGLRRECTFLSTTRWMPACFRVEDHLRDGSVLRTMLDRIDLNAVHHGATLAKAIRELVRQELSVSLCGPVRLLTFLRNWGYYFAPLNVYYCFDDAGRSLSAIVAEVSNTPWLETYYYVLNCQGGPPSNLVRSGFTQHAKEFHVSPFMPMEADYAWHWWEPDEQLRLTLVSTHADPPFVAQLRMHRVPLTNGSLALQMLRQPWLTGRVWSGIYWQALRLWMKKCPYFPHPQKQIATDAS